MSTLSRTSVDATPDDAVPIYRTLTLEQIRQALPAQLPAGIAAIIKNYYDRDPISFNTDWDGTMPMWGMLMWARRGVPGALAYVQDWFAAHLKRDPGLSDEQFYKTYTGHRSRVVRGRHLPFAMYCGLFAVNFPCAELYRQAGDRRAQEVCLDVAEAILYRGRRNHLGLAAHDDHWVYDIPDACFFNVEPLMHAASVDPTGGEPYVKLAVAQLRAYVDVFLDRELGLARTILGPDGLGKTYWCRAQGWLMWSFLAVLRGLEVNDPARAGFLRDLEVLADGIVRVVDGEGAIHAFANDPGIAASLPETSGTAMAAITLHESMRRGWLDPHKYAHITQRLWEFCRQHVTAEGGFEKVYTEWALPAELSVESSKTVKFGPHVGALLWLAHEMTIETADKPG
ncbi:MAG: glycoside hydrolase family 88 protein [Phycisphaeraceae bacterium]